MVRLAFIHSHDVIEISRVSMVLVGYTPTWDGAYLAKSQRGQFRPNVWIHWLSRGSVEHRAWGEVTDADYRGLSDPDSSWYAPQSKGTIFRFVYEDGEFALPPGSLAPDPDDPLYIPW